jgi:hypothetical protein
MIPRGKRNMEKPVSRQKQFYIWTSQRASTSPASPSWRKEKENRNVVKQKEKEHSVLHCLRLVIGPAPTAATLLHVTRKVLKQFQTVKELLWASEGLWGSRGTFALYLKIGSIWISVGLMPWKQDGPHSRSTRFEEAKNIFTSAENRTARNSL